MGELIYHIFDKVFKKILTLSSLAVINMINGLFDTNYPSDSAISYNWTEFQDKELKMILADTILTINGTDSYHLEAQMNKDKEISDKDKAISYYKKQLEELTHLLDKKDPIK